MDSSRDSLNSFMTKSLPTYESLFKAGHSDRQALVLFENYICYRALLDVLSLRTSRWELLVKVLYHQVKDALDEECIQWLRLVHLSVLVREAIQAPDHFSLSNVLKCLKMSGALFPKQEMHRELADNLNRSLISYFLLLHKDKDKVLETCDINGWRIQEVVRAFPFINPIQRHLLMNHYSPNSVLQRILTELRSIVIEIHPPALVGFFDDKCESDIQGSPIANQMLLEPNESTTVEMKAPFQNMTFYGLLRSTEQCKICNTAVTTTTATSTVDDDDDDDDDGDDVDNGDVANDGDSSKNKKTPFRKTYFLRHKTDGKAEAMTTTNTNDGIRNNPKNTPLRKDKEYSGKKRASTCRKVLPKKRPRNVRCIDFDSGRISSDDDLREEDIALHKPRRVKHQWTPLEVKNLLDGVKNFGVGNWSDIYLNYYFLPCRNNVSLKDKWRNMMKNKEVPEEFL